MKTHMHTHTHKYICMYESIYIYIYIYIYEGHSINKENVLKKATKIFRIFFHKYKLCIFLIAKTISISQQNLF